MSIAYSFGSKPQTNEIVDKRNYSPGPAAYEGVNMNSFRDKNPEWSLSKSKRAQVKGDGPGPGAYDPSSQGAAVKFSIGSRTLNDKMLKIQGVDMPGPAQYDTSQLNKNKSPQYTLGGKRKDTRPSDHPGPGAYSQTQTAFDTKMNNSKRDVGFGTSARENNNLLHSKNVKSLATEPGPGAYTLEVGITSSRKAYGKFGKEEKNKLDRLTSPGPGAYEKFETIGKGKAAKIGNEQRPYTAKVKDVLPGPGSYDQNSISAFKSQMATSKLSKAAKFQQERKEVPGPGTYDAHNQYSNVKIKSQNVKFGTQKREAEIGKAVEQPGPGNYNLDKKWGGQSYKFGEKTQRKLGTDAPGPGAYEPNIQTAKERTKTYKIGTSSRGEIINSKSQSDMPGPGNYNADEVRKFGKNTQSFSIKGKYKDLSNGNIPGPGAYDLYESQIKENQTSYKFSQSKRGEIISKSYMELPGPGNYNDDFKSFGKDAVQVSIRGKTRETRDNQFPGPGSYDQNSSVVKEKSKTYRIGTSQRQDFANLKSARDMPGPGNYEVIEEEGSKSMTRYKGPCFTMGSKNKDLNRNQNPGPGSYNNQEEINKFKSQSVRFGSSKRQLELMSKSVAELPGPGNYDESEFRQFGKNAQAISIRGKPKDQRISDHPGPGTYEDSSQNTKEKAYAFKMGTSKRQDIIHKSANELPGPGNYQAEEAKRFGKAGPKFTFSTKPMRKDTTVSPGPGAYDEGLATSMTRAGGASIRIGSASRGNEDGGLLFGKSKDDTAIPGPGMYDAKSSLNGPSFAFNQDKRLKGPSTIAPGPGAYSASDSIVKDKTASVRLGTSQRNVGENGLFGKQAENPNPGPGNYDIKLGTGVSHKFDKSERKGVDSGTPGPGQYYIPVKILDVPKYNIPVQNEEFKWV